MDKPNCYECKHRRAIPGDAHSRCAHPDLGVLADESNPLVVIVSILGGKRLGGGIAVQEVADKLNIRANYHGIRRGWFNWPMNFDPVWLENCDGFDPKSGKDGNDA